MPKPYSADLRQRVVRAVEKHGMRRQEVAETFSVSRSFVDKLLRRWRATGGCAPRPHAGGVPARLAAAHDQLRAWVAERNDRTLAELAALVREHLGMATSAPVLSRTLRALGLRLKKSR